MYIIVCMLYTPHGIYHLQLYTIGTSHLHPVTYHLKQCNIPEKSRHIMPYTIKIGIYREARIGQTCIYHGIYHPDYCIYHGIYQRTGIYHAIYYEATLGPGSRQVAIGLCILWYILWYIPVCMAPCDICHDIYLFF
jgi:hypothetical protein